MRTWAEVAQISDRSSDDVEPAPRIAHYTSAFTSMAGSGHPARQREALQPMSNVRWTFAPTLPARWLLVLALSAMASCTSLGPGTEAPPSIDRAHALERAGDH